MKHQLTEEEKQIEKEVHRSRSVGAEKRARIEAVIARARKNAAISLRLSTFDLEMVKKRAEQEGLPYQTLINMVIHKFVTDQLYEKNEVRKILAEMREKD